MLTLNAQPPPPQFTLSADFITSVICGVVLGITIVAIIIRLTR